MDDAGDVPEDRQQDVEPEMQTQANREEDAHRWQQDRQKHADNVQYTSPRPMGRMLPVRIPTQAGQMTFPKAAALATELCGRVFRWPDMLTRMGRYGYDVSILQAGR